MSVAIEKKKFGGGEGLSQRIAAELGRLLRENLVYFQQFDRVIIYYDRGQKEITKLLKLIFLANLSAVEFRVVSPDGYKLFQVADLVCTLEMIKAKRNGAGLSRSESNFFHNFKKLKKAYLEKLDLKRL